MGNFKLKEILRCGTDLIFFITCTNIGWCKKLRSNILLHHIAWHKSTMTILRSCSVLWKWDPQGLVCVCVCVHAYFTPPQMSWGCKTLLIYSLSTRFRPQHDWFILMSLYSWLFFVWFLTIFVSYGFILKVIFSIGDILQQEKLKCKEH